MVFAHQLEDERVPDWHNYYVNYARLKGWIHEVETCGSAAAAQQFFEELTLSFRRVDGFYNSKEDGLLSRLQKKLAETPQNDENVDVELESIEEEMNKLWGYADVNQDALKNIAIKFDEHTGAVDAGKDGSQKIAGQSADWGGLSEPLGPRVSARLSTYRFGNASERIGGMSQQIKAWKAGATNVTQQVQDLAKPLLVVRASTLRSILQAPTPHKQHLDVAHAYIGSVLHFLVISAIVVGLAAGKVASDALDTQSYVVIWVTAITLTLLVWQWPSDGVMLGATLFLNLSGLIDAKEAWGGFSNEVVLSVAALSVVGDIVSHTGFVDILFAKLIGQPGSLAMAHLKIFIPCAMGAATMSNTAVMACCMPAIEEWCSKSGYHVAMFFMPISYLMLIAGTIAIFSTSTNMVAQALLMEKGFPSFGAFDLAGPAFACTGVSLIYLVVATPIVLRRFKKNEDTMEKTLSQTSDTKYRHWYARVQVQSQTYHGETLRDSGLLAILPHGFQSVMAVERYCSVIERQPCPDFVLNLDDIIELRVRSMTIELLCNFPGIHLLALGASEVEASSNLDARELAEVCLDMDSSLVGKQLAAAKTYDEFGASIVGYRVRDENWTTTCETTFTLAYGDQMVLDVPVGFCQKFGSHSAQFLSVRQVGGKPQRHADNSTAYLSGAILGVMLVFMALEIFPLFPCVLAAIFALVVTGCSSVDGAKKAVPLKVVCTIVGAFGLGNSIGKHGIATFLGSALVCMFSPFGKLGLLVAVAVAVVALGVIFHGTAVVALMFPTCISVAQTGNIPIHQMIAVLCLSVACQMLSPVSYNTNLMAYAACPEYVFKDFVVLGAPLVGIILLVAIPMCQLWFPE